MASGNRGNLTNVNSDDYEQIDAALLALSEARERAEQAGRAVRSSDGPDRLVQMIEQLDKDLLAMHGKLKTAAYFEGRGEPVVEQQLSMSA